MALTFEIHRGTGLMVVVLHGRMDTRGLRALDHAFYSIWEPALDRILMDYRDLDNVDIAVKEFIAGGFDSQDQRGVDGPRVRAAYVSSNDVVYAFTRIIQSVWEGREDIEVTRELQEGLAYLGLEPSALEAIEQVWPAPGEP